jgi:hypothetical protein
VLAAAGLAEKLGVVFLEYLREIGPVTRVENLD